MDAKSAAEASAIRLGERVIAKHGHRAGAILAVISGTESHTVRLGLTQKEFACVVQELQSVLDEWVTFQSKN